jgi:hypothetical protein
MNDWKLLHNAHSGTAGWFETMRRDGVRVMPLLDWDTTRLYPAWADAAAIHAHLEPGAVALEFGPGSCEGALARQLRGITTVGVGNGRLVLDLKAALKVCLATAEELRSLPGAVLEEASAAIAGAILATPNVCPRPEHNEGDGLDLLSMCVSTLAGQPGRIIPEGQHMHTADRAGHINTQAMQAQTRMALDTLARGEVKLNAQHMAMGLHQHAQERLMAVDMRVGDFSETEALLTQGERFDAVFDSRALAHAPALAMTVLNASAQRLKDAGLLVADGVLSAYDYAFDHAGLHQAMTNTRRQGVRWWVVLSDAESAPAGVVAAKNPSGTMPSFLLQQGYHLCEVGGLQATYSQHALRV